MSVPGVPSQFVGVYTIPNNYIDFSWNAPSGQVLYYYIYYYPSVGLESSIYVSGTEHTYHFINLTYGLSYRFRISAWNQYGESQLSDYTPYFSIVGLPTPPVNMSAYSRPGDTFTLLTWLNPTNLLGSTIFNYIIRIYINNVLDSTVTTMNNNTQYKLSNLSFGIVYNFSVAAVTNAGQTDFSVRTSNFLLTPSFPTAPTNVTAISNPIVKTSATVSWTASDPVGSSIKFYTIILNPDNRRINTNDPSTTFDFPNLEFNKVYQFQVFATNSIGQGPYSVPSSVFSLTNTAPDSPTLVIATSVAGSTSATVSWIPGASNGSDILYYTILGAGFDVSGSTVPIVINNLLYHTVYHFQVIATNSIGSSDPSISSASFSLTPSAPNVPTDLSASSLPGETTVHLSWTIPGTNGSDITGYEIRVTPSVGNPYMVSIQGNTSTASIPNLLIEVIYTFDIYAVSNAGNSSYSTPVSGFKLVGPPSAPYNISAIINPNSTETPSIQLFWNPPIYGNPIISYNIGVYIGGVYQGIIQSYSSNTNIIIQYLSYNVSYQFTVQAVNQYGNGSISSLLEPFIIHTRAPLFPPTNVRGIVVPGYTNATILWNDPIGNNGGLPIVSHTIQLTDTTTGITSNITF